MSKFVFLLCAFLLVGSLCADDATTQEEEVTPISDKGIQNKELIKTIDDAIKQINEKVQEIAEKISEYAEKLKDKVLKEAETIYDKIVAAQKSAEVENVNATECAAMAEAFKAAGLKALADAGRCSLDIIEDATGYMKKIIDNSKTVLKNLISTRDEVQLCVKDVDDIKYNPRAIYCLNVAAAKGTWALTKTVPSLLADIEKLHVKISNFFPELTACSTKKGVNIVYEKSSKIVKKVKECVKERKAAADAEKSE